MDFLINILLSLFILLFLCSHNGVTRFMAWCLDQDVQGKSGKWDNLSSEWQPNRLCFHFWCYSRLSALLRFTPISKKTPPSRSSILFWHQSCWFWKVSSPNALEEYSIPGAPKILAGSRIKSHQCRLHWWDFIRDSYIHSSAFLGFFLL